MQSELKKSRKKHKAHGTHGPMFVHTNKEGETTYYAWNAKPCNVIRGRQRKGIRARDLNAEAVFSNEETSPRIEVPRSIVMGMRVESNHLTAADIALFWRFYAHARLRGMDKTGHAISLADLMKFLGWQSVDRVKRCLERLRTATVSHHFNQEGHHGRKSVPMLILVQDEEQVAALSSADEVQFMLPKCVCDAALAAKDYAWVDINALSRFKSRFSATMFMRLSLMAGYHEGLRHDQKLTLNDLKQVFGLPEKFKRSALLEVMHNVQDDIEAISGPRRRFNAFIVWPSREDDYFNFNTDSSIRRTRDVKPKPLSQALKDKICDRTRYRIKHHEYPSLLVIRQAATLHCVSPLDLSDQWRLEVLKARRDSTHTVAGMTSEQLFELIKDFGADSVFEAFADKRDFSHIQSQRAQLVEYPRGLRPLRYRNRRSVLSPISVAVESEVEEGDDDYTTFGSVDLNYGAVALSRKPVRFAEVDDEEIPY